MVIQLRKIRKNNLPQEPKPEEKEVRDLIVRIQKGDNTAQDKILKKYKKSKIEKSARFFFSGYKDKGTLDLRELEQEVEMGLIGAAKEFDLNRKNVKFLTFAFYKIRAQVQRHLKDMGIPIKKNALNKCLAKAFSISAPMYPNDEDGPTKEQGLPDNQPTPVDEVEKKDFINCLVKLVNEIDFKKYQECFNECEHKLIKEVKKIFDRQSEDSTKSTKLQKQNLVHLHFKLELIRLIETG